MVLRYRNVLIPTSCGISTFQVAQAMSAEINQLEILVNQFDHPFHTHSGFIRTYKRELHTHIANGLGRNLTARCGPALSQSIEETKTSMTGK